MLADVPITVIQADWQSLTALGGTIGAGIVAAARLLANQWGVTAAAVAARHAESRSDAKEARDENRVLSQAILAIQAKTVETLTGLQREIEHIVKRLDSLEGSKPHPALPRGA